MSSSTGASVFIVKMDPYGNFIWARTFSGFGSSGISIAVDAAENVYTTGKFYATVDFDPGPGVFNLTATSNPDIFISKLDASGNFVWAKALLNTHISGAPPFLVISLAIDNASGAVYINGPYSGTVDFDPSTSGVYTITSIGSSDIFTLKLDSLGNFLWAKSYGSPAYSSAKGITLDPSGNVYCVGEFTGTVDFDPGTAVFNITGAGSIDIFITKLNSAGNFIWGKSIGGTNMDIVYAITSDFDGNIYTTGDFGGTADFDPGVGTYYIPAAGSDDFFVSKLDPLGNFVWAKAFGGMGVAVSHAMVVDSSQNVYTTGYFSGTCDFDPGTGVHNLTPLGNFDIFVCKQTASGNLDWVKTAEGTDDDNSNIIALNPNRTGAIYIAGEFSGTSCSFNPNNLTNVGGTDAFIAKLGTCSAHFTISPDTIPHNWLGINNAEGVQPLSYSWNWGDGSPNSSGAAPTHTYAAAGYYNICLTITDAVGCTSSYCDNSTYLQRGNNSSSAVTINFTSNVSVGINDEAFNKRDIAVTPNPASDHFTINGLENNDEINIINTLGQSQAFCCNTLSKNPIGNQLNIDITNWNAGIYFVNVKTKNGMIVEKIIVNK
jgi:hypothetical protein